MLLKNEKTVYKTGGSQLHQYQQNMWMDLRFICYLIINYTPGGNVPVVNRSTL